jgi:hypothetical protein
MQPLAPSAFRLWLALPLVLSTAPAAAQRDFAIRLEQATIDLHHALAIEIQIMRIDAGAERIWNRSAGLVGQTLPACLSLYQQSHDLIPPLDAAFRARDVASANHLARQAADLLAAADDCARSTDVFASGGNGGDEDDADADQPAADSWQQSDQIAGEIIGALKFALGTATVDELSQPRSHEQNIQTAVELAVQDYFAGVLPATIVARLTRGQVNNFVGQVGQRILQKLYPGSRAQARIPEVPGRVVDLLDEANRIAREVKVGAPNPRSAFVTRQINDDALLVQLGYQVEWWNIRNPLSSVQTFSDELVQKLMAAGIRPVSHISP